MRGPGRLDPAAVAGLLADVEAADEARRRSWPGAPAGRQPVQVLYVPADRVTATTAIDAGATARDLLDRHAPTGADLARATGMAQGAPADRVRERVAEKLVREPVEDLRVDFEDGYPQVDDAVETADAIRTGAAVAQMIADGTVPPFVGLRVKPFCDGTARRSVTTLDAFLGSLLAGTDGALPGGFAITFPKIMSARHVAAFADVLTALEAAHGLPDGALGFEAQIETTQSVLDDRGAVALRALREAGAGRLRAVHFGVFDYTAAVGLPAEGQRLDHPACDVARHLMQITFAGTEVRLSDGSTNARPASDATADVHAVWARHAADVRHSLAHGFVQGWDLHPSHLVSRYATVFTHLLTGIDSVLARLDAWERQAAADGGVMDEPATIAVLQRVVDRARAAGAI